MRSEEGSGPQGGGFLTQLVASEKLVQWLHVPRHPDSCCNKDKVEIRDSLPSQRLRETGPRKAPFSACDLLMVGRLNY